MELTTSPVGDGLTNLEVRANLRTTLSGERCRRTPLGEPPRTPAFLSEATTPADPPRGDPFVASASRRLCLWRPNADTCRGHVPRRRSALGGFDSDGSPRGDWTGDERNAKADERSREVAATAFTAVAARTRTTRGLSPGGRRRRGLLRPRRDAPVT